MRRHRLLRPHRHHGQQARLQSSWLLLRFRSAGSSWPRMQHAWLELQFAWGRNQEGFKFGKGQLMLRVQSVLISNMVVVGTYSPGRDPPPPPRHHHLDRPAPCLGPAVERRFSGRRRRRQ